MPTATVNAFSYRTLVQIRLKVRKHQKARVSTIVSNITEAVGNQCPFNSMTVANASTFSTCSLCLFSLLYAQFHSQKRIHSESNRTITITASSHSCIGTWFTLPHYLLLKLWGPRWATGEIIKANLDSISNSTEWHNKELNLSLRLLQLLFPAKVF